MHNTMVHLASMLLVATLFGDWWSLLGPCLVLSCLWNWTELCFLFFLLSSISLLCNLWFATSFINNKFRLTSYLRMDMVRVDPAVHRIDSNGLLFRPI
jgi:hypothetical protein